MRVDWLQCMHLRCISWLLSCYRYIEKGHQLFEWIDINMEYDSVSYRFNGRLAFVVWVSFWSTRCWSPSILRWRLAMCLHIDQLDIAIIDCYNSGIITLVHWYASPYPHAMCTHMVKMLPFAFCKDHTRANCRRQLWLFGVLLELESRRKFCRSPLV